MRYLFAVGILLAAVSAEAAALTVGTGKMYSTLSAALSAANNGDTIQVDAGTYQDQYASVTKNGITIEGVGGRPWFKWVTGGLPVSGQNSVIRIYADNVTIKNLEISGAVSSNNDAAGIRIDPVSSTTATISVQDCYIHDNQNGILTSNDGKTNLVVLNSEFNHNAQYNGTPLTHNLYIGRIASFTMKYSYVHRATYGHNVKTRARKTELLYNRIMDEADGRAPYLVDIPDCGETYVIGNLFHKGTAAQNYDLVAYGYESAGCLTGYSKYFYVINNTLVSDYGSHTLYTTAKPQGTTFVMTNNLMYGAGSPYNTAYVAPLDTTNYVSPTDPFVSKATYDYHLASAASGAIDAGTNPGTSSTGVSLDPVHQYVHPLGYSIRTTQGAAIDIGAYEYLGSISSPPTVVSTTPSDGETLVSTTPLIIVRFSEDMDVASIVPGSFILTGGGVNIACTASYSSREAIFTPTSTLANNTTYTATVTTAVKDVAGNPMASNYTWNFTTGQASSGGGGGGGGGGCSASPTGKSDVQSPKGMILAFLAPVFVLAIRKTFRRR